MENLLALQQLITSPTRVVSNCSSIIDLIFTNVPEKHTVAGVFPFGLSYDHFITFTVYNTKVPKGQPKLVTHRNYKKFNENTFS